MDPKTHRIFTDDEVRAIRARGNVADPRRYVSAGEEARSYRVHINTIYRIRRFESYAHVEAVASVTDLEIEASADRLMQAIAEGRTSLEDAPTSAPAPTSPPTPLSDAERVARGFLGEEP